MPYKIIICAALTLTFIMLIKSNLLNGFNLMLYELNALMLIKNLNDLKYY